MPTDNEYLRQLTLTNPLPSVSQVQSMENPGQVRIFSVAGRSRVSIGIRVENVATSVTIELTCALERVQEFLFPLSADGNKTFTLTEDGHYLYTWEGSAEYIRVAFDSGSAQVFVVVRAQ
ncbi:MAG: hypothetical protein HC881_13215 [Leptolyngbyaceae cyanobacterium SL_7_1]|nr:hypothetical protein [Leptolyngbyaceae cyanobacterium SL_7_1]